MSKISIVIKNIREESRYNIFNFGLLFGAIIADILEFWYIIPVMLVIVVASFVNIEENKDGDNNE